MHGGEHTPQPHQPDHEAVGDYVEPGIPQDIANRFTIGPVQAYVDYLDDKLGQPLSPPLREGFRWFLDDAIGLNTEDLTDDEHRILRWLEGWDHDVVGTVGTLIVRARAQAFVEGRQAELDAEGNLRAALTRSRDLESSRSIQIVS